MTIFLDPFFLNLEMPFVDFLFHKKGSTEETNYSIPSFLNNLTQICLRVNISTR